MTVSDTKHPDGEDVQPTGHQQQSDRAEVRGGSKTSYEEKNLKARQEYKNKKYPEHDFLWVDYAEPHIERRHRMLRKYGKQIRALMGFDPLTKYIVLSVVTLQICIAVTMPRLLFYDREAKAWDFGNAPWYKFFAFYAVAWVVGGTCHQNLFLCIHEITHNLAYKTPMANNILSFAANLPVIAPFATTFKWYHAEHHRYMAWDFVDTDLPTETEGILFSSMKGKAFFLFFQIFFYAFRPMLVRRQKFTLLHLGNWSFVIGFWVLLTGFLYYVETKNNTVQTPTGYFNAAGTRAIMAAIYCLLSDLCCGMFHPTSGHFLSEHYLMNPKTSQETFSYYGWMNILTYNGGYHVEHHDFPNIPWRNLPRLREIAPEYYEPLEKTSSWAGTVWTFLTNPEVGAFTRLKREREEWKKTKLFPTTQKFAPMVLMGVDDE